MHSCVRSSNYPRLLREREKEREREARCTRTGNENFLSRGANRTRGFPRFEIRHKHRGDKERPQRERCKGETEGGERKKKEGKGRREEKGPGEGRMMTRGEWRERSGSSAEDDVGKEEANQKRKYAPARPEALRRHRRPRAAFSSLNCNFI